MTKEINGVIFTECSAIAKSIGDNDRQNALFVHDIHYDHFGDGDGVVFWVDS